MALDPSLINPGDTVRVVVSDYITRLAEVLSIDEVYQRAIVVKLQSTGAIRTLPIEWISEHHPASSSPTGSSTTSAS
jgi:hypothetical protein